MPPQPPVTDIKGLLEETLALAKENNKMLRAMRRNAWIGILWRIIFWAVIILLPVWLYTHYLAPGSSFSWQNLMGLPSQQQINAAIQQYQAQQKPQ